MTQADGGSNTMPPNFDPVFSNIQRHQAAWDALRASLGDKDEKFPKLALEDAWSALVDLVGASAASSRLQGFGPCGEQSRFCGAWPTHC